MVSQVNSVKAQVSGSPPESNRGCCGLICGPGRLYQNVWFISTRHMNRAPIMAGWQFCLSLPWPLLCGGSMELWTLPLVANGSENSGHRVDNATLRRTADRLAWALTRLIATWSLHIPYTAAKCLRGGWMPGSCLPLPIGNGPS